MKNPWMKFYPADWRADPALRSCSIAARGLWVEMLAIMHDAEPYGSLLVNGQRLDKKRLSALAGAPERECSILLLELEGVGVFSRDDDGTIYSRRMRRDAARSEEGRRQIAKRWGNSSDDRDPNRSPTDEPITQKLEARSQSPEREAADAATPKSSRKKPRMQMPDIFPLSEKNRSYAGEKGLGDIERIFAKFKNYHQSKGSVFASWDAAWRTWVDNEVGYEKRRGPDEDSVYRGVL